MICIFLNLVIVIPLQSLYTFFSSSNYVKSRDFVRSTEKIKIHLVSLEKFHAITRMLIVVCTWVINRTLVSSASRPFALIVFMYYQSFSSRNSANNGGLTVTSNYKALGGIVTLMRRWERVEKPRKEPGDGASEQVARY